MKEHEDFKRPSEVLSMSWQAKKLPSDEELLKMMEEAASKEPVQRTEETNTGLGGGARRALVGQSIQDADSGEKRMPHTEEEGQGVDEKQPAKGGALIRQAEQGGEDASRRRTLQPVNLSAATTAAADARVPHPTASCEPGSVGVSQSRVEVSSTPQSLGAESGLPSRDSAPVEQAHSSVRASSQTNLPSAISVQPKPAQHEAQQGTPSSSRLPQQAHVQEHERRAHQDAPKVRQVSSRAPNESPAGTPRGQSAREENGVFWLKGKRYQKLKCVGKGGSSKVWKVSPMECLADLD